MLFFLLIRPIDIKVFGGNSLNHACGEVLEKKFIRQSISFSWPASEWSDVFPDGLETTWLSMVGRGKD